MKFGKKYWFGFAAFMAAGLCGCFDSSNNNNNGGDKAGSFYIAGAISQEEMGTLVASYWKDGVRTILGNDQENSVAYGIALSGNDVYVSGMYGSLSTHSRYGLMGKKRLSEVKFTRGDTITACYWKNGTHVSLAGASNESIAYDIAVSGSNIYACGLIVENGIKNPCYWVNGVKKNMNLTSGSDGQAVSMAVSGCDIYCAGFDGKIACYWKNGIRTDLSDTTENNNQATDIWIQGTDIYIVGNIGEKGVYWKNGIKHEIPECLQATGITFSGADILISGIRGTPTDSLLATAYWKNDIPTSLDTCSSTQFYYPTSISVSGNDIYITETELHTYVSYFWKNTTRTSLSDTKYKCSVVFGTCVQ